MKSMKRVLTFLLAFTMVFSFAACGDKEAGSGGTSSQQGSQSRQAGTNSSGKEKDGFTVLEVKKAQMVSDMEITEMKMGKKKYAVDETMTVTVTWKGTPAEDAWIGIVPADIPHGSEEENDMYDISYLYFTDMKSGDTFTFENIPLEPGDYTMRINESDSSGIELAWCAFSVTKGTASK